MHPARPLLVRAPRIITCDTDAAQCDVTFERLGMIEDGALLALGGRIAAIGTRREVEHQLVDFDALVERAMRAAGLGETLIAGRMRTSTMPDWRSQILELDLDGIVVPGLVDAHAHPLYAGDREADFAAQTRGAAAPLGMLHTIQRTRAALLEPERFWDDILRERLYLILKHGTTTLETKTGYALHKPGEDALLDVIRAHRDEPDLPRLISTFLGPHTLPPEFADEVRYMDYVIEQCLPTARAHGAVYADAFCEPGWFSSPQTRRYLEAARAHGLRLRVHCDELSAGGAATMAAQVGVDAVDHCNYIAPDDVRAIVAADIVTVACPATIAYLDLAGRAPVRALLEGGGRVAIASDYNPGTSPCFNLATVAFFGRALFGLSAAEALDGVTRSAARSLRADAGSLRLGGPADFACLAIESPQEFGWQFGGNLASVVVRAGRHVA
ncbi:MAG: amidohydrolase family protein [Vulcanimicrobiaceae bacterium]